MLFLSYLKYFYAMPPGSRKEPIQHIEIIHFHFVIMAMMADGRVLSNLIPTNPSQSKFKSLFKFLKIILTLKVKRKAFLLVFFFSIQS